MNSGGKGRKRILLRTTVASVILFALIFPIARSLHQAGLNSDLVRAVDRNDPETVALLLRSGADPNAEVFDDTRSLWTRLVDTIQHRPPAASKGSIMLRAAYWFKSPNHGATIDNVEVIKALVGAGANVNVRLPDGSSPLIAIVSFGKVKSLKTLLDHGADVRTVDEDGDTGLHIAASTLREDMAALLLEHGADLQTKNHRGVTPLLAALEHYIGESEIDKARTRHMGKFLLSRGATLEGKSQDGMTLRELAKMYRNQFHDPRVDDLIKSAHSITE